jgi:hypothetical protein
MTMSPVAIHLTSASFTDASYCFADTWKSDSSGATLNSEDGPFLIAGTVDVPPMVAPLSLSQVICPG